MSVDRDKNPQVGSVAVPEAETVQSSSHDRLAGLVGEVAARKEAWVALGLRPRIELLERVRRDTHAVAARWVAAECERKHINVDGPIAGEEWFMGPSFVLRNLRLLADTLGDIDKHGRPRRPRPARVRPDGQVVAPIFPANVDDRLLMLGVEAEVWMEPGVMVEEVEATAGGIYREGARRQPGVGLVLGAGNVSSIPANDALFKMFAEDQVVVLKLSPLTAPLGPVLAEALGALIDGGFLRIVEGGAEEAAFLAGLDQVDAVHVTGSDQTHDDLVFGTGEDGAGRKATGQPRLGKPVTSELGSVTPLIVVPGRWSDAEIAYHGENIATTVANNAGCNCIATRVIVTHRGWDQRQELLDAVRRALRGIPNRYAFYPGAAERFELFMDAHPHAERLGAGIDGSLPWALTSGVDPGEAAEMFFNVDPFTSVFCEAPVEAGSVAEFVDRAVAFCNDRLRGTLAATVIVARRSRRDPEVAAALGRATTDLRYGSISFNHWCASAYALVSPPWGAFPGHPLTDIGSGRGFVHNTFLFPRPQKTVVKAPFRLPLKPPWFASHRHQDEIFARVVDLEAGPTAAKLAGIVWPALRG